MSIFNKQQLSIFAGELVVVVLGILIAFQVEEWGEKRQADRALNAALARLHEEAKSNLDYCANWMPRRQDVGSGVEQVYLSLSRSELRAEEIPQFEKGLVAVSMLPTFNLQLTVVDEMISTGLLKDLEDDELRQAVADIHQAQRTADASYMTRRESVRELAEVLRDYIDVELLEGPTIMSRERKLTNSLELETRVVYDFDELAASRRIRNLFFEALDSHADQFGSIERLCALAGRIDARLDMINYLN